MSNTTLHDKDMELWKEFNQTGKKEVKTQLIKRFEPLIHSQVKRWQGIVPNDVLKNEAKVLTSKAITSYDPKKGTKLSTHITNNLAPLSRTIYTYQNTARLPENLTLKMHSYNAAQDYLTSFLGRDPTTDEIKDELGWTGTEINRIKQYNRNDLLESGAAVSDFFDNKREKEDDELAAIYYSLLPDEKKLFEDITGYNGAKKLDTQELLKKHNMTQAQLSYKKTALTNKIKQITGK